MLLEHDPDVDAIFCGSDQIARGALDVLHELGRDVPGDVAVLGFDNWAVVTASSRPELSSIDMQLQELGRVAANLLFAAIADGGDELAHHQSVACRVVVRGSTTPTA
jgi:LacI family transcriptional regulator